MFCPSCGIEYSQKLNYCKRCGASLGAPTGPVEVNFPRPRIAGTVWAIALFGLVGLIADFTAYAAMADHGLHQEELLVPFVFGLFFIFGVSGLLIWQLARLISTYQQAVRQVKIEPPTLIQVPQLTAPPFQVPSVTEHTTRSFDPTLYPASDTRE